MSWLAGWLVAWLADWLVGWLAGWLVLLCSALFCCPQAKNDYGCHELAGWLAGCMAGWLGGWLVGWLASWLLENNVATDFPENTSNAVLPIPRSSHSRPTQAFEALGEAHALTRYQQ